MTQKFNFEIHSENDTSQKQIKQFNKYRNKGIWFVKYYADWCYHCQAMKPSWKQLTIKNKNNNKINFASIEEKFHPNLIYNSNIVGYPTIRLYKNGDSIDYLGDRSLNDMQNFLDHHLSTQIGGSNFKRKTKRKNNMKRKSKKKNIRKNPSKKKKKKCTYRISRK